MAPRRLFRQRQTDEGMAYSSDMLRPRGHTGLEATIVALATSICPRLASLLFVAVCDAMVNGRMRLQLSTNVSKRCYRPRPQISRKIEERKIAALFINSIEVEKNTAFLLIKPITKGVFASKLRLYQGCSYFVLSLSMSCMPTSLPSRAAKTNGDF